MRTFYQNIYAKEMRTTNVHKPLLKRFEDAAAEITRVYKTYGMKVALIRIVEGFLNKTFSEYIIMLYAAWKTVWKKTMYYGECLVVISTAETIYDSFNEILESFSILQEQSLYIEDLLIFLRHESKIEQKDTGFDAVSGDICLDKVSFQYIDSAQYALKDVNLRIRKGEKIAVVGANGAGKTTLIKLLLRLYDPTEGRITLNEKNYTEYKVASLRELYSVVLQDYKHFSLTVKENVELGISADETRVWDALDKGGLMGRVQNMRNGIQSLLDKEIDERGELLSGGEEQKLAIAHVYLKNSDIVILDEPASALDPLAEHDLYERMMTLSKDKTVIFVSHRLSSAIHADRIVYLEHGSIAEYGSHKELMEKDGLYAKMFRIQAQNYMEG